MQLISSESGNRLAAARQRVIDLEGKKSIALEHAKHEFERAAIELADELRAQGHYRNLGD